MGKRDLLLFVFKALLILYALYSTFQEVLVLSNGVYASSRYAANTCYILPSVKLCQPILQFAISDGTLVSYTLAPNQQILFDKHPGQTVDIVYDSNNPHRVLLNNIPDKWLNVALSILGGIWALFHRKKKETYSKDLFNG